MSPPPPTLPLIDIVPFLNPTSSPALRAHCAQTLASACITHGFFCLTHHGVPPTVTSRILNLARGFFTECTEREKRKIIRQDAGVGNGDGARGYQVVGDNVTEGRRDWHEAIDWYRPVIEGEPRTDTQEEGENTDRPPPYDILHGVNQWPQHPEGFREVYEEYVSRMLELGTAVVRAMGVALLGEEDGKGEVFVRETRKSWWVMRAIGYPPLPARARSEDGSGGSGAESGSEEDGISCGAHTDYGCLTLLLADDTKGALQVQARDGSGWINADPVDGAFVVNIGDMMERWTNGLWKSTRHRVVHRGECFRVSGKL